MKKRLLSLAMALCLVLSLLPASAFAAEIVDSGSCGDNLTWTLDDAGKMTITGTGYMESWTCTDNDALRSVVIESGVESIGDGCFGNCPNLQSVTIPASVMTIGPTAFENCSAISDVWYDGTVGQFAGNVLCVDAFQGADLHFTDGEYVGCGICGSDLIWTLDDAGEMTITGTGAMNDWFYTNNEDLRSVVIESGAENIGDGSFGNCQNLQRVTIPASVTAIGNSAFENCPSLADVRYDGTAAQFAGNLLCIDAFRGVAMHFTDGDFVEMGVCGENVYWTLDASGAVTVSGSDELYGWTFSSRSEITSAVLEDGVIRIGDSAFEYCSNLAEITLPSSLGTIENGAFRACTSLQSITIPASVTDIGGSAFEGCSALTDVYFEGTVSEFLANANNIEISVFCGATLHFTDGDYVDVGRCGDNLIWTLSDAGEMTIRGSGEIGSYDFSGNQKICSLVLESGVTRIGSCAFESCEKLASVSLPNTLEALDYGAFSNCDSLQSVSIPASVTSIEGRVFADCDALTDVYFEISAADFGAMNPRDSVFSGAALHFTDGEYVDCGVCGEHLTWTLDENGLLTIRGTGEMYEYPFNNSEAAQQASAVVIESGVTTIGNSAFHGRESLESVTIPNTVLRIGDNAFNGCTSLTEITIPSSVTDVGGCAFDGCGALADIWFDGSTEQFIENGLRFDQFGGSEIHFTDGDYVDCGRCGDGLFYTLNAAGLLTIRGQGAVYDWAFSGREAIRSVVLESGVTKIGSYAFENCANLERVALPDTLEHLAYAAFSSCVSLTEVTIPPSVTVIEGVPFSGCSALTDVYFDGYAAEFAGLDLSRDNFNGAALHFKDNEDYGVWGTDWGPCGDHAIWIRESLGSLRIRGTGAIREFSMDGKGDVRSLVIEPGVTDIGTGTFVWFSGLTSVTIPDGVTSIGDSAFGSCSALARLTIPDSVETIGSYAFSDCGSLKTVTMSAGLTTLADHAFVSCGALTDITLPESLTSIGEAAFFLCESLTSIGIPAGVTSIEANTFDGCYRLAGVTIPESVTSIGDFAFHACNCLADVVLPAGLTHIGVHAFDQCEAITGVTIPAGVTSLEEGVFNNCYALSSVALPGTLVSIGEYAFYNCDALTRIVIPDSVTTIRQHAFDNCDNLDRVELPAGVQYLGNSAFESCYGLQDLAFAGTEEQWYDVGGTIAGLNENVRVHYGVTDLDSHITILHTDPTCTEDGFDEYSCGCGMDLGVIETYPATGHDWGEWTVTQEADNTQLCEETRVCGNDPSHTETRNVPQAVTVDLGDNIVYVGGEMRCPFTPETDARYRFEGINTEGDTYLTLYDSEGNELARDDDSGEGNQFLLEHALTAGETYLLGVRFYSSESEGVITFRISLHEHEGELQNAYDPTCTEPGYSGDLVCVLCGDVLESGHELPALGHTIERENESEPTCTEPGYSGDDVCSICGETLAWGYELPALGHDWGEWTVTIEPTGHEPGEETRVCLRDSDHVETREIPPLAPDVVITSQTVNVSAPAGTAVTFDVEAEGVGLTYQWQYSADGGETWRNSTASSAKTASLSFTAKASFDGRLYHCIITDAYGQSITSDPASLQVVIPLEILTHPEDVTAAPGQTVQFSVEASGEDLTYQWQYCAPGGSWANSPAAGNKTAALSVPATASRSGYQYRCVVRDSHGSMSTSAPATLTVQALAITSQPQSITTAPGTTVYFTVDAEGVGLTYQWQLKTPTGSWKNATASSAKTARLTVSATAGRNGYQYRCVVTDAGGNQMTSEAALLTTAASLTITSQPQSVTTAPGTTVHFTVEAEGTGLAYQWQLKTPTGDWQNSTAKSGKTASLTVSATNGRNGYQYRCVVTDANGNEVISDAALLTVAAPLAITGQPQSVTTEPGTTVYFTVEASGSGLAYQWQLKTPTGDWQNSTAKSGKTASLTVSATTGRSGYQYRCIITDANGNQAISDPALLTVAAALAITSQPQNLTAAPGATAKFTVAASGTGLTYQWQYSADNGATWKNSTASSGTKATLSFTAKESFGGRLYRCVVTDASGHQVISETAVLTVAAELAITGQPQDLTAASGANAKFTVTAVGSGLTYQWQYSADNGETWSNSTASSGTKATLSFTAKASFDGRLYRCVVTDAEGNQVVSEPALLTVQ